MHIEHIKTHFLYFERIELSERSYFGNKLVTVSSLKTKSLI